MKNNMLKIMLVSVMVLALAVPCFAGATKTISVTATIPTIASMLNVTVSKVRASDDYWEQSGDIPINFGTLTYDTTWGVFRAAYYYAVDVGVTDTSGTIWSLTHTRTNLQKDATNNLNNNVNVTFMKQLTSSSATQLSKVSYTNSNNVAYNKTQLSGGWLRIYYGIGTGSGDAPGVLPITADNVAGTYTGSVTITLSP